MITHGSHTERTRRQPRPPRRSREGRQRLRAELPAAAEDRPRRHRGEQAADRARAEAAEARDLEEKSQAEAFGQRLSQTEVEIARRVGENNTLYGSVTSADIAQALVAKGFEIDKRKIHLPDALKALGEVTVQIKVHREVTAPVKVTVVAEKR